jgi:O-antigen ligase
MMASRPVSGSDSRVLRLRPNLTGIAAFVCGVFNPVTLNVIGEICVSELLLPLAAIAAFFSQGGDRALHEASFRRFLAAAVLMLAGYMLSDFVQDTRPDQYLRGWGRVGFLIADFIALAILIVQDRRNLWWFALGMGVGGILYLRLVLHTPISVWKFGYAEPVLLVAVTLGGFFAIRLAGTWLGVLGAVSMWFDFRSFAAICFLLGAYMWTRAARPVQALIGAGRLGKAVAGVALAGVLVATTLSLTDNEYMSQRREQSNAGRSAAFEVGLIAIARSPLIGYGSWTENRELAQMYLERYLQKRGMRDPNANAGRRFSPHSQILQSWVEGGILGATLFLVLGGSVLLIAKWASLIRPMDMLTGAILYILTVCAWNLMMSPFGASHRTQIALGAAVIVLLERERRSSNTAASRQGRQLTIGEPLHQLSAMVRPR